MASEERRRGWIASVVGVGLRVKLWCPDWRAREKCVFLPQYVHAHDAIRTRHAHTLLNTIELGRSTSDRCHVTVMGGVRYCKAGRGVARSSAASSPRAAQLAVVRSTAASAHATPLSAASSPRATQLAVTPSLAAVWRRGRRAASNRVELWPSQRQERRRARGAQLLAGLHVVVVVVVASLALAARAL